MAMLNNQRGCLFLQYLWIEIAQGSRTWCCAGLEAHVGDLARTKPTCVATGIRGVSPAINIKKNIKMPSKCHTVLYLVQFVSDSLCFVLMNVDLSL